MRTKVKRQPEAHLSMIVKHNDENDDERRKQKH